MIGLPRIVFVLGKGGVGRSTVAAALGSALAARGKRVLVLEWTVAEAIAPWFGAPGAGVDPVEIAPGLSVANYRLDAALRAYFVDHLHLGLFYRRVVDGAQVRRLIQAAPGIEELLFLGQLWWLTTLAEKEAHLSFDTIVVDSPATGHAASLLELPETLSRMHASGLLGLELERVTAMMKTPSWTGALIVAAPEELVIEETLELVPRVARALGRPPLAALVNRSVGGLVRSDGWIPELSARLSPPAREGLAALAADLAGRTRCEIALRRALDGKTERGTFALDEQLASSALEVVRALSPSLGALFGGGA